MLILRIQYFNSFVNSTSTTTELAISASAIHRLWGGWKRETSNSFVPTRPVPVRSSSPPSLRALLIDAVFSTSLAFLLASS